VRKGGEEKKDSSFLKTAAHTYRNLVIRQSKGQIATVKSDPGGFKEIFMKSLMSLPPRGSFHSPSFEYGLGQIW
jgi:hypothetical protein